MKLKKVIFKRWLVLPLVAIGLICYPVNNSILKISLLVVFACFILGALWFGRNRKPLRYLLLGTLGLVILFLVLPGREANPDELRKAYVQSLHPYEGTRYVWGGENRFGIDCSGLVRKGMINANTRLGAQTLNPELIREAISHWWNDSSARALAEEYRGKTHTLFNSQSINEIEPGRILPGDIAVTEDGVHVMAYLGDASWIEADPEVKRVIKVTVPSTNDWFNTPVTIMRWTQFK